MSDKFEDALKSAAMIGMLIGILLGALTTGVAGFIGWILMTQGGAG